MTENDYVATATAEKRLREVMDQRFGTWGPTIAKDIADWLLAGAEITYLPRKRSVSILLRYPETTATKNGDGVATPPVTPSDTPALTGEGTTAESATETPPPAAPSPTPVPHQQARFGLFTPADRVSEGDYFTE